VICILLSIRRLVRAFASFTIACQIHVFRHRLHSCSKIFETWSGSVVIFQIWKSDSCWNSENQTSHLAYNFLLFVSTMQPCCWKWTVASGLVFKKIPDPNKTQNLVLQPLRWCCAECAVHHERNVREEKRRTYVARTSNNRVIAACDLYCCLLPQCEALRTCRPGFLFATLAGGVDTPDPWLLLSPSLVFCSDDETCHFHADGQALGRNTLPSLSKLSTPPRRSGRWWAVPRRPG